MIRVDNIELKEKLRSKKKRVAEDLGISRQAFAQKLEDPLRFRLTEINALIDLGYGECIYIDQNSVDQLRTRSSKLWRIQYKISFGPEHTEEALSMYQEYFEPANTTTGIGSYRILGTKKWDLICFIETKDVHLEALGNSGPESGELKNFWDILPADDIVCRWARTFYETCKSKEKAQAIWHKWHYLIEDTEYEIFRPIF
ncbi:MAG: hypothetical protein VYE00_13495 [Candidatus Poribacteria bacterium]|nr:hypothetical protein [Candidatus Poribacteria bacterium]MEC9257245.1 hypothetical protein [Candidatus Poribacteria bacterium]|tara:strand:+ start:83 stop:682 length:600 start_codon:yes stop_codon:yes gene_type:complete